MNYLFLLLSFFLLLPQVEQDHTYKTECTTINSDGTILLKIWDTKGGKKYKIEDASGDAIQCLLYDGFAGKPCGYMPPLLKTREAAVEFEAQNLYFFKKSGKASDYVISSVASEAIPAKMENKNWVVYEIVVDRKKLDQYLVDSNIREKADDFY